MTKHDTGAPAPFIQQQRSIHEVASLIGMYVSGHTSIDAALFLAAIRARRAGVNSLEFVDIVKTITPRVSVPAALMAWLNAPRSSLPPVPEFWGE